MSIYIKGLNMPKGLEKTITIYPSGMVRVWVNNKGIGELLEQKAIHVPPHGRLGDLDRMLSDNETYYKQLGRPSGVIKNNYMSVKRSIEIAPTIIPADPPDKEGE